MAHLHKKIKSGIPYYYIREIQRVNGKPTVVNQVYLGSPERILELFTVEHKEALTSLSSREFGSLFIFNEIDKEVGFAEIVDSVVPAKGNEERPTVGRYCYYALLNRIIEPLSKLRLPEWYKKTDIQHLQKEAQSCRNNSFRRGCAERTKGSQDSSLYGQGEQKT